MYGPGIGLQPLEQVFVGAIVAGHKNEVGLAHAAMRRLTTSPLLAQAGFTSTIFSPRKALSSVSASIASSIDTSSFANHSPNSGSAMR